MVKNVVNVKIVLILVCMAIDSKESQGIKNCKAEIGTVLYIIAVMLMTKFLLRYTTPKGTFLGHGTV